MLISVNGIELLEFIIFHVELMRFVRNKFEMKLTIGFFHYILGASWHQWIGIILAAYFEAMLPDI